MGGANTGQKTNSPIVGINVVKLPPKTGVDPGSRVKVSAVTSDDPTPHVIEGVKFNTTVGSFTGKRAVWRELVQ